MRRLFSIHVLLIAGCCHTPAYLEPGGHSTTYRRHVDHFDATLWAGMPFGVQPCAVEPTPVGEAETNPATRRAERSDDARPLFRVEANRPVERVSFEDFES